MLSGAPIGSLPLSTAPPVVVVTPGQIIFQHA